MKAAATCTWLGDLVTALMVTDMMLQDNLYPHWATGFRRLYRLSNVPRILIFWCGSIVVATVVIFLIVSDYISWDKLNQGFVETTGEIRKETEWAARLGEGEGEGDRQRETRGDKESTLDHWEFSVKCCMKCD